MDINKQENKVRLLQELMELTETELMESNIIALQNMLCVEAIKNSLEDESYL